MNAADSVSAAQAVEGYLDHLRVERGSSPHTVAAYRRDLRRYVDFLHSKDIDDLGAVTPEVVAEFAGDLRSGSLAPASTARIVVAVRSLHRFAADDGLTSTDPAREVTPPKTGRRLPKGLSLAQVQALLDTPLVETPLGLRDAALLELLYGTGARISELVDLDVDDVSRLVAADAGDTSGLRLFGKGSKERWVPVGSYAREALRAYLVRARPGLVTKGRGTPALLVNSRGGRLTRQSAWTILRTAATRAGITAEVSPHTLRHSYATHLLEGGADVRVVQELLGHASVTTTQIYTMVTVDHLREVYRSAHPRATG
ncbi:MAG TPA: site-specific tyrosine recombinase XerD [Microlunatus sp.]|nr:site-specific tyrosine recombinase XerD [Microlunatus sp.]